MAFLNLSTWKLWTTCATIMPAAFLSHCAVSRRTLLGYRLVCLAYGLFIGIRQYLDRGSVAFVFYTGAPGCGPVAGCAARLLLLPACPPCYTDLWTLPGARVPQAPGGMTTMASGNESFS